MGGPEEPEITPQQLAFEKQQQIALNKEVQEENRRRKALARGRLGAVTLLSATPSQNISGGAINSASAPIKPMDGGQSAAIPTVAKGTPARVVSKPKSRQ